MSVTVGATNQRPRMTLAEFNALPDDPALDRMLIRGRLWEKPHELHTRGHSITEATIVHRLLQWAENTSSPRGVVLSGQGGCDLPELETSLGVDVAFYSPETIAAQEPDAAFMVGPPVLAVEILAPSDSQEEIHARIDVYRDACVKLVWIVDPHYKMVIVFCPDTKPELLSGDDRMSDDTHLSGFCARVGSLFE